MMQGRTALLLQFWLPGEGGLLAAKTTHAQPVSSATPKAAFMVNM
jgi:hypothetical protein